MSGIQLNLGPDQVLEADRTALPAILDVCQSLDIPVRWNESECTLYIAPPVHGRKLALQTGLNGPETAAKIVGGLHDRLAAAGAAVTLIDQTEPGADCELLLRIGVVSSPAVGVSATFNWIGWRLNRKLAALLTEELAKALEVPDLGGRAALAGWRQAGVPVLEVSLPYLDDSPDFVDRCIERICHSLNRFWTDPQLTDALTSVIEHIPAIAENAEPHEPEPSPDVEETVLILGPETIIARRQEPLNRPAPVLAPSPGTSPAPRPKQDRKPRAAAEAPEASEAQYAAPDNPAIPATPPSLPAQSPSPGILHVFQYRVPFERPDRQLRPTTRVIQQGITAGHTPAKRAAKNHPR